MGEELELNTKAGINISGSKENYISVLRLTEKYANDKMEHMQCAYESESWEIYETEVHSLKSSMASIGAERLSKMAKCHEEAAKNGDFVYIKETYYQLVQEFQDVLKMVHIYIQSEKLHGTSGTKRTQDESEVIRRIADLVREFDFGRARDELETLERDTEDGTVYERCGKIRRFLEDFNGEEAITVLENWLQEVTE